MSLCYPVPMRTKSLERSVSAMCLGGVLSTMCSTAGVHSPKSTAQQAQARKEHLTQLFLNRGCRVADVQK